VIAHTCRPPRPRRRSRHPALTEVLLGYTREDLLEAWERMNGTRPLGPKPRPIRQAPASVERPRWDNTPMPREWFDSFSAARSR
jgi:hypothetical protein